MTLPHGWTETAFGDAVRVVRGVAFSKDERRYGAALGYRPLLRSGNVQSSLTTENLIYVPDHVIKSEEQIVQPFDSIVSMSNSFELVGKVALAHERHAGFTFGAFLSAFRSNFFDARYLFHLLRSPELQRLVRSTASQTVNIANISARGLAGLSLPVPPLAEQRRIVAKLELLSDQIGRARAAANRAVVLSERLRQSILSTAFDRMDPGAFVPLRSLTAAITSGSRDWSKYYDRGSSVFVLAGNVRPMSFDPTPKRTIDPPHNSSDAKRSRVAQDDLLITIVGAGTGQLCRVPDPVDNYFVCQSVALVRLVEPSQSRLFELFLNADRHGAAQIRRVTYGQGRPHLSFDDIESLRVPNVPRSTAAALVQTIEAALSRADRMATEATRALRLLDRLEAAILAKAFRGELVPQDPNDEPAAVLLERTRTVGVTSRTSGRPRRRRDAAAA